jgi:hypothetical protein
VAVDVAVRVGESVPVVGVAVRVVELASVLDGVAVVVAGLEVAVSCVLFPAPPPACTETPLVCVSVSVATVT